MCVGKGDTGIAAVFLLSNVVSLPFQEWKRQGSHWGILIRGSYLDSEMKRKGWEDTASEWI